ncbi:puff II/9-2 protein-like [Palaemon carinicauda]|uniref:puff II/9-2 protein-like n=1 Tax=Palaemon carinicauda TaxID=392227 RepID=UPI0035B68D42
MIRKLLSLFHQTINNKAGVEKVDTHNRKQVNNRNDIRYHLHNQTQDLKTLEGGKELENVKKVEQNFCEIENQLEMVRKGEDALFQALVKRAKLLEGKVKEMEENCDKMKNYLHWQKIEISQVDLVLERMNKNLKSVSKTNAELCSKIKDLEEEKVMLEEQLRWQNIEVEEMGHLLQDQVDELIASTKENDQLRQTIKDLDRENKSLESKVGFQNLEIDAMDQLLEKQHGILNGSPMKTDDV